MDYKIIPTEKFKHLFKKLLKKYPSLKEDLLFLIDEIQVNPNLGINLGSNLYKIRLKITSKNKGKSSGARIIYYIFLQNKEIYLIYIYDKSEQENISKHKIINLLNELSL